MNNMTKYFLVMVSLVAGSFTGGHCGWDMQAENEELLIDAASQGDSETVSMLLALGVDVNARNKCSFTALIIASLRGHTEVVRRLLAVDDINVNTQDGWGETALILASARGRTEIVRMLLDAGADITLTNKKGKTALDLAREKGTTEIVKLLKNIITDKAEIEKVVAAEWQELPREVRNVLIMPFLNPNQK